MLGRFSGKPWHFLAVYNLFLVGVDLSKIHRTYGRCKNVKYLRQDRCLVWPVQLHGVFCSTPGRRLVVWAETCCVVIRKTGAQHALLLITCGVATSHNSYCAGSCTAQSPAAASVFPQPKHPPKLESGDDVADVSITVVQPQPVFLRCFEWPIQHLSFFQRTSKFTKIPLYGHLGIQIK